MRFRRVAGSLLALITLHLNLLGADFACAKHTAGKDATSGLAMSMPAMARSHTHDNDRPAQVISDATARGAENMSALVADEMLAPAADNMAAPAADNISSSAAGNMSALAAGNTSSPAEDDVSLPNVANETPPCDVPVQPTCCKALASCSIVFSAANELDVASALTASELIAPSAMNVPRSERAAPEPPPPKS